MLQRIQSLYLLLAAIFMVACLSLPIGNFIQNGKPVGVLFNLWVVTSKGQHLFAPWPLFVLLLLNSVLSLINIFFYKRRVIQARMCIASTVLVIVYVVAFTLIVMYLKGQYNASFSPTYFAALPILSLILNSLAFRGVLKDEAIVRSLDRLR